MVFCVNRCGEVFKLFRSLWYASAFVTARRCLVRSAGDAEFDDETSWTGLNGLDFLKVPIVNARIDAGLVAETAVPVSEVFPNWLIGGQDLRDLAGEATDKRPLGSFGSVNVLVKEAGFVLIGSD